MKRRNEFAVGVMVTIAVIILVAGSLWLGGGGFSKGYELHTRFAWGQNLKEGEGVLLAGVSIGSVSQVELRRAGYLDVTLNIQKKYKVPRRSTATVVPNGIFGDYEVALTPPDTVPPTDFKPGDTISSGVPIPGMGDILLRVDSIGETMLRLEHDFEADFMTPGGMKDVRKFASSMVALSGETQHFLASQNESLTKTEASIQDAAGQIGRAATRLSTVIDSAAVDSTLKNLRTTSANAVRISAGLDSSVHQFRHILWQADSGQGSLPLFLRDPSLFNHTNDAIQQMQSLLQDLQKNPRKYINLSIFGRGGG